MLKLLLDANLSWRMCVRLTEEFGECHHVNDTGLIKPAKDSAIWQYAHDNGYIIVSQDSDFRDLLEVWGFPPKLIQIRTGNMPAKQIAQMIIQAKNAIIDLQSNDKLGLLEIV
jgi:predicted nuclease of predicted toxin-antitoxin system